MDHYDTVDIFLFLLGGIYFMSKVVRLNKKERHFLDGKFFLIKKEKVISREILESGKIISNENCLKEGEIVGDFFRFLPDNRILIPETEVEIEALEDNSVLEEFDFSSEIILQNDSFKKIIQLIKKSIIKFFYQLYDTKGYILAVLKLYADSKGKIVKSEINYENFNVSRSQFYFIFSGLKKEKFISEEKRISI